MTRTFAVDAQNDLVIGSDDRLTIATDLLAVLQNCEHAAKTILAEMVLAIDQGLPYFEAVWIGVPNLPVFEAAYRQRILTVEGVTGIVSVTLSVSGNVLSYQAEIQTLFGTGVING